MSQNEITKQLELIEQGSIERTRFEVASLWSRWRRPLSVAVVSCGLLLGTNVQEMFAQTAIEGTRVTEVAMQRDRQINGASAVFNHGRFEVLLSSTGPLGREIHRSVSNFPTGPWSNEVVFRGTGRWQDFDGAEVFDPTFIVIHGVHFMYYSGRPLEGSPSQPGIGVAVSTDGGRSYHRWTRGPILTAFNKNHPARLTGAGHPTVLWDGEFVTLFFDDPTSNAANQTTGGGTFAVRSRDAFMASLSELTANGWIPRRSSTELTRDFSIFDSVAVDVSYLKSNDTYVMAVSGIPGMLSYRFFDGQFRHLLERDLDLNDVFWNDGPGLLRDDTGNLLPHGSGDANKASLISFTPVFGLDQRTMQVDGIDISLTDPPTDKFFYSNSFEEDESEIMPTIQIRGAASSEIVNDPARAADGDRFLEFTHFENESEALGSIDISPDCTQLTIRQRMQLNSEYDNAAGEKKMRIGFWSNEMQVYLWQWVLQLESFSSDHNQDVHHVSDTIVFAANDTRSRGRVDGQFTFERDRFYQIELRLWNGNESTGGRCEIWIDGKLIGSGDNLAFGDDFSQFANRVQIGGWWSNGNRGLTREEFLHPKTPATWGIDLLEIIGN